MRDISFVDGSGTVDRAMGQSRNKKKVVARRHLVCGNCASWILYETSGCEMKWADTIVEGFVFTCKGCIEMAGLVKEVSGLKQMVEDMKETVAGLQLEEQGADTGNRATTTGVNQDREETAGNSSTEDRDTVIEDEGEGRAEERTEICAGTTTGVSQDREETAGSSRTEDTDKVIEDVGEGRTEERTEICAGTTRGVSQDREDREETAGNSMTEDTGTVVEDEGEGRTEERTEICAGTTTGVSQDREETAESNTEKTNTGG